jgi:hypothetical protein
MSRRRRHDTIVTQRAPQSVGAARPYLVDGMMDNDALRRKVTELERKCIELENRYIDSKDRVVPMGEFVRFQLDEHVVQCGIVRFTKEMADQALSEVHEQNRSTAATTEKYVLIHRNDGWKPTPEPVIRSDKNKWINGANRFRTVSVVKKPMTLTVWKDWPEDVVDVLDRGRTRTPYQAAKMRGETYAHAVLKMARAMVVVDKGRSMVADHEMNEYAVALEPAWMAMEAALSMIRLSPGGIRVPVLLAICVAWFGEREVMELFVSELLATSNRDVLGSVAVRNFIRWYESQNDKQAYSVKTGLYGTATALKYLATGGSGRITSSKHAYVWWRERPGAVVVFGEIDAAGVTEEEENDKKEVAKLCRRLHRRST